MMDPVLGQGQPPHNPTPQLPAGWIEFFTPTGQPYWYNTFTTQSSWVFPIMATSAPKKKKQIKKKVPGTQWLFVLTHDSYEFYYDRETKKSVWEMPEELTEPMEELKKLEQENKKRALLEEQEEQEALKRVKLEEENVEATEMTEEDIMWQLQQMEGEEQEDDLEQQLLSQQLSSQQLLSQQQQEKAATKTPVGGKKKKEPELSEEECINKFNELLEERNISPFAVYSVEFLKLMTDARFSLVQHNKQKSLFNKYCNTLGEKIKNEKNNKKKPEDEFKELLLTKVTSKMYWDDFRRKFKDDSRFKGLTITKEKEALFKDHVKHNLSNNIKIDDDYIQLLKETKEISKGIRWRDAKKILEKDDRYFSIKDKDKREDLFRDYLDSCNK